MNQYQANGQYPSTQYPQGQMPAQAPNYQSPQQFSPDPAPKGTSGLAIAGLVLGIVAILTSFMPIINNISFFIGIVGLVLAIIGMVGISKGKNRGKGLAIAAIVLNVISLVVVLASQAFYSAVLDSAADSLRATPASSTAQSATSASTQTGSSASSSSSDTAALPYIVTIDSAELTTDYSGNQAIIVTYTFTNNSTEDKSFILAVSSKAFQNGVQLDSGIVKGVDSTSSMKEIKTGATITVQQAFVLDDASPVTVEVEELFNFSSDELIAERTFDVA